MNLKSLSVQIRGLVWIAHRSNMGFGTGPRGREPSGGTLRALRVRGLCTGSSTLTMSGYAMAYRVAGPRCGECEDCQEWLLDPESAAACMPKALEAASYFGAECAANPGSNSSEYLDDMALRAGHEDWKSVPSDEKSKLLRAFQQGKKREQELNRGY